MSIKTRQDVTGGTTYITSDGRSFGSKATAQQVESSISKPSTSTSTSKSLINTSGTDRLEIRENGKVIQEGSRTPSYSPFPGGAASGFIQQAQIAEQQRQAIARGQQVSPVFTSELLGRSFSDPKDLQKAEQEFKRQQTISKQEQLRREIVSDILAKDLASPVTAQELARDTFMQDPKQIQLQTTPAMSRLKQQTDIRRSFFTPSVQDARVSAAELGTVTGIGLSRVDESKFKEFERRIGEREKRIEELEADVKPIESEAQKVSERVEDFNKRVAEFEAKEKALSKELSVRDLEPSKEQIVLSESDFALFEPRTRELQELGLALEQESVSLSGAAQTLEMQQGQLQAREESIIRDYEDITSRVEALQKKESELDVLQLSSVKALGYDLKDFELDYTPVQKKEGFGLSQLDLATQTLFGQTTKLEEPISFSSVEDVKRLRTFEGQRRFEEKFFSPFDPVGAVTKISSSAFLLGGIGAVGGSAFGSSIPLIGTGVGAVAGGVVGFKTGLFAGTADVLASETFGRVSGDEGIGQTAGFVAGITTAVGASSLLLKKETAKRFVTTTGKPTSFMKVTPREKILGDGIIRKGDAKFVEQAAKGGVRVPFTTTIKADTSLLNRLVVGLKDKVTRTVSPKVSQIRIGEVDLAVGAVGRGGVVITKTTLPGGIGSKSTLPIKGGIKTDFVSDIAVTSKFIQKGTIRDKLTSFFSKQDKGMVVGADKQGVVKLYLDKPSSLFQKTVSRFKGERFVEDRFKDVGRVEALGWQPIAKTKKGTIELFMDRITTGRGLDGFQLTKLLSGKKDYLGVSISKDWGTGSITQTQFVGQKVSGKFAFGKQQSPIIDTGKMLPGSSMRLPKPFFDKTPMTQSQALSYIESLSKQTLAPKVVAKQTVKTIEDQGAKIATQIINTASQPKNLGSIYGSVVLTRQSQLPGYTGQEQVLVSDVSFAQPQVGRTGFAQPQAVTVDRVVDKLRVDVGTQPVLRTSYDTLLRTDFGRTTDKLRVDSEVKQLEKLRTDYAFITQPRVRQSELLGLKEMFSTKTIEKTRLDLKQLELIRLDSPTLPSVPRITTPIIPVTPPFVPLYGWGRMDVGAGLGGFARRRPVPRTKPLVAIKSDLFRKFVSGETDLLVSPENVRLVKRIRARRGSLLGIIPTKEQLKKKKKKGELTEEELLKRFGVF